jgi:hypothetical protein
MAAGQRRGLAEQLLILASSGFYSVGSGRRLAIALLYLTQRFQPAAGI